MGGAARLFHRVARNARILSPSLPLFSPNHSTRTSIPLVPFRANQSNNFNSESIASKDESFSANVGGGGRSSPSAPNWYHPWPEWAKFIYGVRQAGYFERANHSAVDGATWGVVSADDFSSPEFLRAAKACLEFARDRDNLLGYLSRSDIGVVVENGSAFMFRDAEKLRSRMKSFLGLMDSSTADAELDKATLVDLMKFLLSYANIRPASSASVYDSSDQIVVSSVRNLLSELASFSYGAKKLDSPSSMQNRYSDRYGQAPRPQRRQIEMKAGDWICPRCTFMNFARNVKCANCEEGRPRNILTNQWECPQSDFINFGRNITCKKCNCKRPGEMTSSPGHFQSSSSVNTRIGSTSNSSGDKRDINTAIKDDWSGKSLEGSAVKEPADPLDMSEEAKAERWFRRAAQIKDISELSQIPDEDFPSIMPMRKGVNRFVVSKRKTPLERRLTSPQYKTNLPVVETDPSKTRNESN